MVRRFGKNGVASSSSSTSGAYPTGAHLTRARVEVMAARVHVGMTMTTHAFLFREYELEYRLDGSDKKRKLLTTPQHLVSLHGREAVAHVREGRLGWPWVETVTTP